jgi:hypothetical protein
MFFVGAFSGNLLYLILAISSLAGCSAMVFRGSESQPKEPETQGRSMMPVLYDNQLSEICTSFYTKISDRTDNELLAEITEKPPLTPFFESHFIPPLLTEMSHFSGSPIFSRPPPFFLV